MDIYNPIPENYAVRENKERYLIFNFNFQIPDHPVLNTFIYNLSFKNLNHHISLGAWNESIRFVPLIWILNYPLRVLICTQDIHSFSVDFRVISHIQQICG